MENQEVPQLMLVVEQNLLKTMTGFLQRLYELYKRSKKSMMAK
jgi:hypothetical protein